jgi:hypothetical protein
MKGARLPIMAAVLCGLIGTAARAAIPNVPDADRYISYNVTSSTATFNVPFPVYGDCTDFRVSVAGVILANTAWSCASIAGGANLTNIARPIQDLQITLVTPAANTTVEILGAWHPRFGMGTAPGISRDEFNRDMGMVFSAQRELFRGLNQPFPSPVLTHLNDDSGNVILNAATGKLVSVQPYPGLNISTDAFRVVVGTPPGIVGGLPQSWEFPGANANGNHTTAAITGATVIPAGSYSGDTLWPDAGVQGLALSYTTGKSAIAVLGFGGVGINGGMTEAFNGVVQNCELGKLQSDCTGAVGFNAAHLYGVESDINVALLSGGGAMTGDAVGFLAMLNGTAPAVAALAGSAAFRAATVNGAKWIGAFESVNGSATVGASFGAQASTGPSNSQFLFLNSLSAGSATQTTQLFTDSSASFNIVNGTAGATFGLGPVYPQIQYTVASANNVGLRIQNTTASVGVAQANLLLGTGTVASTFSINLVDGGNVNFVSGLGEMNFIPSAGGGTTINGPITLASNTGYPKAAGASRVTFSTTIPTTDLSGPLQAAQEPAHTGDVTNTAGSLAMTLASIISAGGPIGSATVAPIITYDAKGRLTAVSSATIAPLFSSIAGPYAVGDLLYAGSTSALSRLADVASGNVLRSGGVATAPAWGKINLSTDLDANTLPAVNTAALSGDVTKSAGVNTVTVNQAARLTTARTIGGASFDGSTNVTLPSKFIVQGTADAGLSGAQFLGALGTGIVKNTTTTGVLSIITEGTGVETALGVNVGTAGAFVVNGGALGTPSSSTLTNATGLPIATGVSGLGTGVATGLGQAATGSGGPVLATAPSIVNSLSVNNSSAIAALQLNTTFQQGIAGVASVNFNGQNSSGTTTLFGGFSVSATNVTPASETAIFNIANYQGGALANRLTIGNGIYASILTDPGAGKANFAGYSVSNTAGVSCTVNTPAHLTVVNGIVTLCN